MDTERGHPQNITHHSHTSIASHFIIDGAASAFTEAEVTRCRWLWLQMPWTWRTSPWPQCHLSQGERDSTSWSILRSHRVTHSVVFPPGCFHINVRIWGGVPKTWRSTQAVASSGMASPLVMVKPRTQLHSQGSDVEPSWSGSSCKQQAVGAHMSRMVIRAMLSGLLGKLAF